jgi:hypothetical protein
MHIQVVDKPEHDVCPISAPELSHDFIGVCFVQSLGLCSVFWTIVMGVEAM